MELIVGGAVISILIAWIGSIEIKTKYPKPTK